VRVVHSARLREVDRSSGRTEVRALTPDAAEWTVESGCDWEASGCPRCASLRRIDSSDEVSKLASRVMKFPN
jgi:hypothetical protein